MLFVNFLILMYVVVAISPSQDDNTTPSSANNMQEDVTNLKYAMKALTVQLSKWNTLFLTSLEPRISFSASLLASVDSNIKNLQGRAHVWDTFQLHVSAWNDQLASLDRKVDIISKGQEKLLSLDSKINAMMTLDYKLDRILKKVDNIESDLLSLNSSMRNRGDQGLFNEFTARGILSTIKMVEKKLDRLLLEDQQNNYSGKRKNVKCQYPKNIENHLKDLSTKVDVIFDKISISASPREEAGEINEYETDEYLDVNHVEGSGSEEATDVQRDDSKAMKKLMRKLSKPCKITNEIIEEVLNRILNVEKNSIRILDNQENILTKISRNYTEVRQKTNFSKMLDETLRSRFEEQQSEFETILSKRFSMERNLRCLKTERSVTSTETTQTTPPIIKSDYYSSQSQEDPEDSATYWFYDEQL